MKRVRYTKKENETRSKLNKPFKLPEINLTDDIITMPGKRGGTWKRLSVTHCNSLEPGYLISGFDSSPIIFRWYLKFQVESPQSGWTWYLVPTDKPTCPTGRFIQGNMFPSRWALGTRRQTCKTHTSRFSVPEFFRRRGDNPAPFFIRTIIEGSLGKASYSQTKSNPNGFLIQWLAGQKADNFNITAIKLIFSNFAILNTGRSCQMVLSIFHSIHLNFTHEAELKGRAPFLYLIPRCSINLSLMFQ